VNGEALAYARDYLTQPDDVEANQWPERDLEDLLPNHIFSFDGSMATPLAAGIVIGTVTSAVAGGALDYQTGADVPFGAANVLARVVELSIAVEHGLGDVSGADAVVVAVRVPGESEPEKLLAGMSALGRVIVVLDAQGRFTFAEDAYSSRGGTRLVGSVSADGTISFPAVLSEETHFIDSLTSVDRILNEASRAAVMGKTLNGHIVGP
jgi:hypothetical protein